MENWCSPRRRLEPLVALLGLSLASACGAATEAPQVALPVVVDGSSLEDVTTDLGYRVHVTTFRVAVSDFQFTVAGEVHARPFDSLRQLLWPVAHAHPGHYAGGEIIGELAGRFLPDWLAKDRSELGVATLIASNYDSANFSLQRARAEQGLEGGDPLLGHTALIDGTAARDGDEVRFSARIDAEEGRQIVGAPFELEVRATTREPIGFAALTVDPREGDTLFDAIDFFAVETDENGLRVLEESSGGAARMAYQVLRRTLQTHDHFRFRAFPAKE